MQCNIDSKFLRNCKSSSASYRQFFRKIFVFIFFLISIGNQSIQAQEILGCTDPLAENFDLLANIDDGSCGETSATVNLLYSEDFEGFEIDSFIGLSSEYFTTWSMEPGSDEDALITNVDGSNVVHVVGDDSDIVLDLNSLNQALSDEVLITFDLFFNEGNGGSIYLLDQFGEDGQDYETSIYFSGGLDSAYIDNDNLDNHYFAFSHQQWMKTQLYYNVSANLMSLYINNNFVHSWTWVSEGEINLAAVDFYTGTWGGSDADYYIDNIHVQNLSETLLTEYGCTDPLAMNYDELATIDDGSCFICEGTELTVNIEIQDEDENEWYYWSLSGLEQDSLTDGDYESGYSSGEFNVCVYSTCFNMNLSEGMHVTVTDENDNELLSYTNTTNQVNPSFSLVDEYCEVEGCTDVSAYNYDPTANVDDGSCFECTSYTAYFDADTNSWHNWSVVELNSGNWIYDSSNDSSSVCLQDSCYVFHLDQTGSNLTLVNKDGDEILNFTSTEGQTTTYLSLSEDTCEFYGCTDPDAFNYDASANIDDGSCYQCDLYTVIFDLDDSDPWASWDLYDIDSLEWIDYSYDDTSLVCLQESCYRFDLYGNIDNLSVLDDLNNEILHFEPSYGLYSAYLSLSDEPCEFYGCTDPEASNYDELATVEDSSCIYCDDVITINVEYPDEIEWVNWSLENEDGIIDNYGQVQYCISESCYALIIYSEDEITGTSVTVHSEAGTTLGSTLIEDIEASYGIVNFSIGDVICTPGCTDPLASNYDPDANILDASCEFEGDCTAGQMLDCNGNCVPFGWLGDGYCDDETYQFDGNYIDLTCIENDNGDCETIIEECPEGQVLDCFGNCIYEGDIEHIIGDGYCNESLNCLQFNFDDGDCEGPDGCIQVVLILEDSYGDGWNGATYTIHDEWGGFVAEGTLESGEEYDEHPLCLFPGEYHIEVGGGSYDGEISFSIAELDDVEAGVYTFHVGGFVNNCPEGEIPDCFGQCVPESWLNDDYCDNALNCPQFNFDDGDCEGPDDCIEVVLILEDSYGDGWNGATYTIHDEWGGFVAEGTLESGEEYDEHPLCLFPGEYHIEVGGGSYDGEISFSIAELDDVEAGVYTFHVGGFVNNCPEGEIPDCFGQCVPESWLNDNYCDNALNCPQFNFDDGDCEGPDDCIEVVLILEDSYGDGWNGATYTIHDEWGGFIAEGTLESGEEYDEHPLCLFPGEYQIEVGGGSYDSEISFSIAELDDVEAGAYTFHVGGFVYHCEEGQIMDCYGGCVPSDWISDNYCDDGLNCPEFGFDGGDCSGGEECIDVVLILEDTYGDGWGDDGAQYIIYNEWGDFIADGTLEDGDYDEHHFCLPPGEYEITVGGGSDDNEILFSIADLIDVTSGTYIFHIYGEYIECQEGEIESCGGGCAPEYFIGDGLCHDELNCPEYNFDGGDCYVDFECDEPNYTLLLHDSYGDGWNGFHYGIFTMDDQPIYFGTLEDGHEDSLDVCLHDGCYIIGVGGDGGWPEEITFELQNNDTGEFLIEGNNPPWATVLSINSDCSEYQVLVGCMDSQASNYDPNANLDIGGCIYDDPNDCGPGKVMNCYGECTPEENIGNNWCDQDLNCPQFGFDGGDCEAITNCPEGQTESCDGSCQPYNWISDNYCDDVFNCAEFGYDGGDCGNIQDYGCTDEDATNYNSDANVEDGSCFYWNPIITDANHTIVLPNTIDESEIFDNGDIIGVFFENDNGELVCAGYTKWTGENTMIAAMGAEAGIDNGFQPGEEFQWQAWDESTGDMIALAGITYDAQGPNYGTYVMNGLSVVESIIVASEQVINIPEGWSMISSYIEPFEMNVEVILSSTIDNVIAMKDDQGNIYWPEFEFNNIGDWSIDKGYQIKSYNAFDLTLIGRDIAPEETPLLMPEGWSIISYLRTSPADVADVVEDILDKVVIVKNYSGQAYLSSFGINFIGDMTPGQGYQINLTEETELTYLANGLQYRSDAVNEVLSNKTEHYSQVKNTGNNMILLIPDDAWIELPEIGDEFIAKDAMNNIVGTANYHSPYSVITIWGDDPLTDEKDGLLIGELPLFELWNKSDGLTQRVNFYSSTTDFNYQTDEFYIAERIEEKGQKDLITFDAIPNPANDNVQVRLYLPESHLVTLTITNLVGQVIESSSNNYDAGTTLIDIDLSNYLPGSYFYNITTQDGFVKTKQLQVVK